MIEPGNARVVKYYNRVMCEGAENDVADFIARMDTCAPGENDLRAQPTQFILIIYVARVNVFKQKLTRQWAVTSCADPGTVPTVVWGYRPCLRIFDGLVNPRTVMRVTSLAPVVHTTGTRNQVSWL